jgi:serine/threonine protein kinase
LKFLGEKKQIYNVGLRLDNIIFNQKKDNDQIFQIKIPVIDCLDENYDISENSLVYYPPEVIEEIKENNLIKNNFNIDNTGEEVEDANNEWACGIIMYYLIAGEFPFIGNTKKEIFSKIENQDIDFSLPKFHSISEECKELISKFLDKDKNERIVINAALGHPFITGEKMSSFNFENLEEKEEIDMKLLINLSSYKAPKSKIHEAIREYIYDNFLIEEEKKKLNDLYKYINKDENEDLTEENLKQSLIESNYFQEEEIKPILDNFNFNEKKFVPKKEFLCALCDKEILYEEANIRKVFFEITKDDEEKVINPSNLQKFLSKDEKVNNYVKDELSEPFGMNSEDNMKFEQFNHVVALNKLYSETNSKKDEKKPKKPKNPFGDLKMLKNILKKNIDENEEKKEKES